MKKKSNLNSKICPRCGGKKSIGGKRCNKCANGNKASKLTASPYRRRDYRIYLAENGKNSNIRRLPQILAK